MITASFIKKLKQHKGPLSVHLEAFAARVSREGHSQPSTWCNISIVSNFNFWLAEKGIEVERIDEGIVDQYLRFRARHQRIIPADRPALNRLLSVLRELEVIAPKRPAPIGATEQIIERFQCYLSRCGGYAQKSIVSHGPTLQRFLSECCPSGAATGYRKLTAEDISKFVTRQAAKQSAQSTKHACWTLRSFLRYLRYEDLIAVDLAATVPSVRSWRFSSLPRFLSPDQVEQVLSSVDRSTPVGRRNYAVLMLLARLGLRASEVATLCLDDIDWRSGQLTIRGKGRQRARMPLPGEVGAAVLNYVRRDRPPSESRRVFLRELAPHIGFSSGTNVTWIACSALIRAGVDAPCKGAHVFRHSLATQLLRAGASLSDISQVLRHRSADSTRIYAKVDVGALRRLAMPWPGGAR